MKSSAILSQFVLRLFAVGFFMLFSIHCNQFLFPDKVQQTRNSPETLFLTNGSVIKCSVVELLPNFSMKVRLSDGQLTTFAMEEIEKIEYATPPPTITNAPKNSLNVKPRFTSIESIGISSGGVFIGTLNGIDLNKILYFGIGIDWYWNGFALTGFPLYFESRIHIPWRIFRPFVYFTGGTILFPANHQFYQASELQETSWQTYTYTNITKPRYDQDALWFQFSFGIGFKIAFYKETGIILQFGIKSWQPSSQGYLVDQPGITSAEIKLGIGF